MTQVPLRNEAARASVPEEDEDYEDPNQPIGLLTATSEGYNHLYRPGSSSAQVSDGLYNQLDRAPSGGQPPSAYSHLSAATSSRPTSQAYSSLSPQSTTSSLTYDRLGQEQRVSQQGAPSDMYSTLDHNSSAPATQTYASLSSTDRVSGQSTPADTTYNTLQPAARDSNNGEVLPPASAVDEYELMDGVGDTDYALPDERGFDPAQSQEGQTYMAMDASL